MTPFPDTATIDAPTDVPIFVFIQHRQIYVLIHNSSYSSKIDLDINFGTTNENEVIGEAENLPTIGPDAVKAISSQTGNYSLYNTERGSSFFDLVTVDDMKFRLPYDPDLTIKGKYTIFLSIPKMFLRSKITCPVLHASPKTTIDKRYQPYLLRHRTCQRLPEIIANKPLQSKFRYPYYAQQGRCTGIFLTRRKYQKYRHTLT